MSTLDDQRREAGEAAALLVEPGMRVGLGTGDTVAWFLQALGSRRLTGLRCVATSPETEAAAGPLGIPVEPFTELDRLDIAVDGADQIAPDRWAVKGGHGAHLREKIVAAAADRFVVIVSEEKVVDRVGPPVPLELRRFGLPVAIRSVGHVKLREGAPITPDGGIVADYIGPIDDAETLARRLDANPGVAAHGLFPPSMIADVFVGSRSLG
jgi:ribose 5-phosphate isomerase A